MILSDALILPVSQLQTWWRHRYRSHIEYLILSYYILVLNL